MKSVIDVKAILWFETYLDAINSKICLVGMLTTDEAITCSFTFGGCRCRCIGGRTKSKPISIAMSSTLSILIAASRRIGYFGVGLNTFDHDASYVLASDDVEIFPVDNRIKIGSTSIRTRLVVGINICRHKSRSSRGTIIRIELCWDTQ